MTVAGAGGGGGQKAPRTPVESPDSLVSIAYARIVDLIAEGEIFGLVNGAESIFLDGTPLESDGVRNFNNVTYDTRTGTQDQAYIPGFAQIESEVSVGAEVTTAIPYVRTITNTELSAIRLNLNLPRLAKQNLENGDLTGSIVQYAIDLAIGAGAYTTIKTTSFNGKTTGGYNRSERIDLPPNSPDGWRVRIRRITPEPTSSNVVDAFAVASVTEIIDAKFRYPNSALVAMQIDAETFGGSIPVRSFDMWGRYMRVPSNYDTVTRTYTGVWDGTFVVAEKCNNPAWVYYDLLLNEFFGLGERINASQIDKWGLYQIAQYCDQMVDDGKGGMEPRFTLNIYIQQRVDALRLLQDISSVFRGITYWGAGQAYVSADMPGDPVYTYTNANVLGGKFSYKGSKYSTRYSVAHVSWNDPSDSYKTKTEYVENQDAVGRFGIRPVSLAAFGCTSQGQAIRAGKWALLTNLLETETVGFSVGLDGIRARPGQVVRLADNDRAGTRIGGRITASTINSVTVDSVGIVAPGDQISIVTPTLTAEVRTIESIVGKVITVTEDFSAAPLRMSPFAIDSAELATQLVRIISISESSEMNFSIVAVKHVPGKYDNIDYGTVITSRPITAIPTSSQLPVTGITATSEYMIDQYAAVSKMTISWMAPVGGVSYDVEWSRDNSDWVYAGRTSSTQIDVQGIFAGEYMVRVKAINAMGVMSIWTQSGPFTLVGKPDNTAEVVNLRTESGVFAIRVRWDVPDTARDTAFTELMYNTTNSDSGATTLGQIAYPTLDYLHSGMGAAVVLWFKARLIDKTGNIGPWSEWEAGVSSSSADEILGYLEGEITATELGAGLLAEIGKISGDGTGSVNERIGDLREETAEYLKSLQGQINDIAESPDWTDTVAWPEGSLVNDSGRLYSAKIDVPIGIAITNTTYWLDIGAYSTLGDAVGALSIRMDDAETDIDDVTGIAVATASSMSAVRSAYRDDNGEGDLADALRGYDSTAEFAQEVRTRATADEAQVTMITSLTATVGGNTAAINEEKLVRANGDEALAFTISKMAVDVGENTAAIKEEKLVRAGADGSLALSIENVSVTANSKNKTYRQVSAPDSDMTTGDIWYDTDDKNKTYIYNGSAWVITDDGRIPENTAAIEIQSVAINDINTGLSAMYTVKVGVDVNGKYYGAGMGIGVENTPAGMQSQVLFLADRFAVMHADGGTPTLPFVIVGGQVFMSSAIIQNASISFAKISDTLQSDNYVANTSGWRLSKAGGFELNASVPGQGRTQITNQLIQIWDSSNNLVVRMGIW